MLDPQGSPFSVVLRNWPAFQIQRVAVDQPFSNASWVQPPMATQTVGAFDCANLQSEDEMTLVVQ